MTTTWDEAPLAPIAPLKPVAEFPPTDLGNCRRFVAEHKIDLRFVPGVGRLTFDGVRFAVDTDGEWMRRAKATVDALGIEATDEARLAIGISDPTARKEAGERAARKLSHALKSQAKPRLEAMVSLAESESDLVAKPADLDRPPLLLNTPNVTVELQTGLGREHRRGDLLTRVTGAPYDRDAIAPRWLSFLNQIMAGDEQRIGYLQRAIGYSVTGLIREQKIFLLLGDGANGKSVFGKTLVHILGDYAAQIDFETFLVRENRGANRGDLVRLRGRRFGLASEMQPGERLDTRRLKEWTGGEDVVAAEKYKSEISFQPITKLWFLANVVPVVQDSSFGIWRRLVRLPFEVTIPEDQRDPDLIEKLVAEGPGIMRWIVDGCRAYLKDGLGEDPKATAAVEAWRSESDQIGRWLNVSAVLVPQIRCARRALRASYVAWCEAEGERAIGTKGFAEELRRRGVTDGGTVRLDGKPVPAWMGVTLDVETYRPVDPKTGETSKNPLSRGGLPGNDRYKPLHLYTREPGEDDEEVPS